MKNARIFLTILILIILILNCTVTYAGTLSDILHGGKDFIEEGSLGAQVDETKLADASSDIFNILTMVSFVVVACVGIVIGIKFMMADVEEKVDAKKSLVGFVIGTIAIYGAYGIWKLIITVLNTF